MSFSFFSLMFLLLVIVELKAGSKIKYFSVYLIFKQTNTTNSILWRLRLRVITDWGKVSLLWFYLHTTDE